MLDHFQRTRKLYRDEVAPILEFSSKQRLDIMAALASGKKVLDVGCVDHDAGAMNSKEWFLHGRLADTAASVKGLDYEHDGVRGMREMGFDVVQGDSENFDLGEKFDMVVAGQIFEHLTNHRGALDSMRRHLNDGGAAVISVPNSGGLFYFAATLIFGHETDSWDHTCMFTPINFFVLLRKCGFAAKRIVLCQPSGTTYIHDSPWQRATAAVGNSVYRAACLLRKSFAREMVIVAEPCADNDAAPPISAEGQNSRR